MSITTDEMAQAFVSNILRKSINTFTSKPDLFSKHLDELIYLFNGMSSTHVNLNPIFMNESTWKEKAKAPMTYIHVFSDDIVNIGIFVLKPNMKLPLHNHPEMYGLLKVIAGTVKIQSYSLGTEKTSKYLNEEHCERQIIVAERMKDIIADADSMCCVLDPTKGNIHEVESVDGPAAFIDILSPPYDIQIPGVGARKCSYYSVEKQLEPKVFKLQEISTPSWFYSDSYPYTGPPLK